MYQQDYQLTLNGRVRLKNGVDTSIYGDFACIGNEGVITAQRKDRFNLPEVFVEWDRNHWSWNGVQNCWTFEDHFEQVEDTMAKADKIDAFTKMMAQGLSAILADNPAEESPEEPRPAAQLTNLFQNAANAVKDHMGAQQTPEADRWGHLTDAVAQKIAESEAFMVITIERHPSPHAPEGMLAPGCYMEARSAEAEILVAAQAASAAARAHQELAVATIAQSRNE